MKATEHEDNLKVLLSNIDTIILNIKDEIEVILQSIEITEAKYGKIQEA